MNFTLLIFGSVEKIVVKIPINIKDDWILKRTQILGSDELKIFERKELCLQE